LGELRGAYAFLLMTRDCVMAVRDPLGFKPLSIGTLKEGYVFASETCALTQVGANFLRDVEPGEMVIADAGGLHSTNFSDMECKHFSQCVFEHVYFARPDSAIFGKSVHAVRMQLGMRLADEHPVAADVVIPVPDSGNSAALGYAQRSGIPLNYGFMRNHYVGRTFIMPEEHQRARSVDLKLAVVSDVVRDKRVVVVDDSIIRGTTSQRRVATLRNAGAREIHVRISCPPTTHPCFFGIDFATKQELAASSRSIDEIRRFIGADSLGYISVEGLLSPFDNAQHFCIACFSGEYPVDVSKAQAKDALETMSPTLNFEAAR
jgi:amidophosphoribosyltransferase